MRTLLLLALLAGSAAAEGEDRLGSLIRWYLNEPMPSRREKFLQSIEELVGGDVRVVARAIRAGRHFRYPAHPALARGGAPPVFDERRARLQPVAKCAGDFAQLVVPAGYSPERTYPLVVEIGRIALAPPTDAVLLRVFPSRHKQAAAHAWAAEGLVLSVVAHVIAQVRVDPARVRLRADGAPAALAWYVALHNPDRFAGVLAVRTAWRGGGVLAPNAKPWLGVGIRKHGSDRALAQMIAALRRDSPRHFVVEAPDRPAHDWVVPTLARFARDAVRPDAAPGTIRLVTERGVSMRSFWLRMSPRVPSTKPRRVGAWRDRMVARPAVIEAKLDNVRNLVKVQTDRVAAFDIYVDLDRFDPDRPLRVSINGSVPQSKLIYPEVADLLADYRERRDPGLLYVDRLTFRAR